MSNNLKFYSLINSENIVTSIATFDGHPDENLLNAIMSDNNAAYYRDTTERSIEVMQGYIYSPDDDIYTPTEFATRPFNSWNWDTAEHLWVPPIPKPDSGNWIWDENTQSWHE
jgi:hypothetical protein